MISITAKRAVRRAAGRKLKMRLIGLPYAPAVIDMIIFHSLAFALHRAVVDSLEAILPSGHNI
jgi:hypothetical protein